MIVTCPNCSSRFRLPDDRIGPDGVKLRCGKCKHVFRLEPPSPADVRDFDYPEDDGTAFGANVGEAAAPAPAGSAREARPEPGRAPDREADSLFASETSADQEDAGTPRTDFNLDDISEIDITGKKGKGASSKDVKRRSLIVALSLFALVVITLAAVFFFDLWPGAKDGQPPAPPTAEQAKPAEPGKEGEKPAAEKPDESAKVKDIVLQNVRQYYVTNEKAGQLFVIEGKAVNNFKSQKEMIKLEAALFDEKGNVLLSKDMLGGNTVSLFQLQVMTRQELESALGSQVGVLTNNTNLAPGAETPFMIVFFDPPEAVKEFGVKVVDAKDPPGK
ncbi:MAG: DUF3426 domain-containing protein [Desulfovibrionaceae bacterium]|nr:DUF3426 domain-containing protein [Desulfovibrionaceae bacterium]